MNKIYCTPWDKALSAFFVAPEVEGTGCKGRSRSEIEISGSEVKISTADQQGAIAPAHRLRLSLLRLLASVAPLVLAGSLTGMPTAAFAQVQGSILINGSNCGPATTTVNGTSIGCGANAANGATALGFGANSSGFNSAALGEHASATGTYATAVGPVATAVGASSVAVGSAASANGDSSIALGQSSVASNAGDVALGANSVTAAPHAGTFDMTGGAAAAQTPSSVVSVGSTGSERQVQNVAAGVLSATSTDAVNGSQLFSVATAGNATGATVASALGGGSTYTPGSGVSAPSYTVQGNTYTNVGDALGGLNSSLTNVENVVNGAVNGGGIKYFHANSTAADSQAIGTDSVAIGPQAVANGVDSFAAGTGAQAQADNSMSLGSQAIASVANGIALGSGSVSDRAVLSGVGSITAGSSAIPFNTSDRTLLGAVSVGNATTNTYRQITNVADGTQAQDAVTIRQLSGALQSFAVTPTMYFHANSTAADSLAVGDQSIAVGPTTVVNGDSGVGIGNGAIVESTAPGGVAIGQSADSAQADAIALGSGASASGAQSIAQGANATATNAAGVAVGSGAQSTATNAVALGAGATASFANSVALGAGSVTTVGALSNYIGYGLSTAQSSVGEVNIGNRQITGVAPGMAGTDAVNVSQLNAVDQQLLTLINNQNAGSGGFPSTPGSSTPPASTGSNSSAGGQGAVASGSDSTAVGNGSTASGSGSTTVGAGATSSGSNSVALGAGSNDGGRTNVVSVGSADTPRQVTNVAAGTAPTDGVNVQQLNAAVGGAVSQANSYTDSQIQGLRRDADAGTASAMAVAGLPQPSGPGKSMVSIAGSIYRSQSGQAVGISTISENNHWIYKAAVTTNTRNDYGAVIGAGYQW
jgi:autotransporter adhesin